MGRRGALFRQEHLPSPEESSPTNLTESSAPILVLPVVHAAWTRPRSNLGRRSVEHTSEIALKQDLRTRSAKASVESNLQQRSRLRRADQFEDL